MIEFADLSAAEKTDALRSLQRAAEELGGESPSLADELKEACLRHAANLVHTEAGYMLNVEHPKFPKAPADYSDYMSRGLQFDPSCLASFNRDGLDGLAVMSEWKTSPIREALTLLVSAQSPEVELDARRARLAEKKANAAAAAARAEEESKRRAVEQNEWNRLNARRIEAWNALDGDTRALFAAASTHSEFRAFVSAFEAARRSPWVEMPAFFRVDLG